MCLDNLQLLGHTPMRTLSRAVSLGTVMFATFLKAFLSLVCVFAGKSLKTLMSKGILQVHPPICDCPGCRISSPVVGIFPPFCHTAAPVFLRGVNVSTGEATQIIFDLGTVCGF